MFIKMHELYSTLRNSIKRQLFSASCWTVILDPAYISHRGLVKSIRGFVKQLSLNGNGIWLDVGCGQQPYRSFFNVEKYIGMEIDRQNEIQFEQNNVDIFYNGIKFPIDSCSIDGVICTQVLEHVENPKNLISEIERVLKPGGKLILTVPFSWQQHEKPYDFRRFTSFGLRRLLESYFCINEYHKTTGSIETIAQALSVYICNNLILNISGWSCIISFALCAPVQLIGILLQKILPDKRDLFLDSAVLAYKAKNEVKKDVKKNY